MNIQSAWFRLCTPPLRRLFIPFLPLLAAAVLSGCAGRSAESEQANELAQETIKEDARAARDQLEEVRGVRLKGGELSGGDSEGRPLWRVSAKEIRVFNKPAAGDEEKSDSDKPSIESLAAQPERAEFIEASATLYNEGKPETSLHAPKILLNRTPEGVRLTLTGGVKAESTGERVGQRGPVVLTAPNAEVNVKERRLWAGKGVRLVQGDAKNRVYARAEQATSSTNLHLTQLQGGVKASSPQGTFAAQHAAWNWDTGRVSAKGAVTAANAGTTITGDKLDADTRAGRGVLSGTVRAAGEQGKATASRVRYDWKKHTIAASGGVVLTKDDVVLQASQIDSDDKFNRAVASGSVTLRRADATLRAGRIETQGKGTQATAQGSVSLTRGDATVSAARATAYNIGEKSAYVVATGNVRVKRGDMTLTAGKAQANGLENKGNLRVVASGGVTATSNDGSVRAGNMTWGGGQVEAKGGVTLLRDGNRLSGTRLVCDDEFNAATLTGNVNGKMANGETIAAGVLVYQKGKGVQGRNGVSARRDDLRLRADRMNTSPDGKQIVLNGNVVVTNSEGASVHAPQVRYDRTAQKVTATGNVLVKDPSRGFQQRGRGLVADLQLKKITLTNVTGSGKMEVFEDKKIF